MQPQLCTTAKISHAPLAHVRVCGVGPFVPRAYMTILVFMAGRLVGAGSASNAKAAQDVAQ